MKLALKSPKYELNYMIGSCKLKDKSYIRIETVNLWHAFKAYDSLG